MFGQFLKPRWQHKDPAIRARAIPQLELGNPEQMQILVTLARGDAAQSVRRAAILRLNDMKLLDQLQQQDHDTEIRSAAAEQIRRLLAGQAENSPSRDNRLRLILLTDNDAVLAYVAQHSDDSECRVAATGRLTDQSALLELAQSGADIATRVAATERLTDAEALRQIVRDGRDKRVLQLARERLKQVNVREQDKHQAIERCATLLKELAAHSSRQLDNLYAPRLGQLEQAWQQVAAQADAAQQQQAQDCIAACHQRIDAQQQEIAEQQARATAVAECAATLSTLQQLQQALSADSWLDLNSLRALIATQKNRWQAATEDFAPDARVQQQTDALFAHWQQCFDILHAAQNGDASTTESDQQWPSGFALPDALRAPEVEAAPEVVEATEDPGKALRKDLTKLLSTLQRELNQRNLKHANRLWRKAEALLDEEHAPHWQPRLEKMRPQLDELRDWHAFAAEPKKLQLCEQMEALIEQTMDVEEKATAIQALHDQWRELMSADQQSDQALWDRFRQASDTAYAPCREHFKEVDALRSANTEKRRQLVKQLDDFITQQDWQTANWQHVFDIRRTAPKEWSGYHPIHFTKGRDLNRQFNQALKQLDQQLDQASAQHADALEKILQQGEALISGELPRDSVDQWKALQQQWNKVAWVQPNRYRSLQKKFRKLGDQLFAQLDTERAQYKQDMQQQHNVLQQALKALQALLRADNVTLDMNAIAQQAETISALPCPPREKNLDQQRQDLLRQARGLRQWRSRWQQWQDLHLRVEQAPEGANSEALQQLAVALEAAAGCESPQEAREQRMQWQLKNLQQAMKGVQEDHHSAVTRLLDEHTEVLAQGLDPAIRARLINVLTTLEPKR